MTEEASSGDEVEDPWVLGRSLARSSRSDETGWLDQGTSYAGRLKGAVAIAPGTR